MQIFASETDGDGTSGLLGQLYIAEEPDRWPPPLIRAQHKIQDNTEADQSLLPSIQVHLQKETRARAPILTLPSERTGMPSLFCVPGLESSKLFLNFTEHQITWARKNPRATSAIIYFGLKESKHISGVTEENGLPN